MTGTTPVDLKSRLQLPETLCAALDLVVQSDEHVLALSQAHDLPPEAPLQAQVVLNGTAPYG